MAFQVFLTDDAVRDLQDSMTTSSCAIRLEKLITFSIK